MAETMAAPVDFLENVAHLRLPPWADGRLQELMDANNEGQLSDDDREQLADLVEWSESLSLLRAQAFHVLGTRPT
jgi:hypothetical protein